MNDAVECDFDSIHLLSSDSTNLNEPPKIGEFLLRSYKKEPIVKIYDTMVEKYEEEKVVAELKTLVPQSNILPTRRIYRSQIDILLHICVAKLLKGYSEEQIYFKCYKLQIGEKIDISDELGIKLLYINKLMGCRYLISSVRAGHPDTETSEYDEKYGIYGAKDAINIRNCSYISVGKAMTYHIVKEHVRITFNNFLDEIRHICRHQEKIDINTTFVNMEIPYFLVGIKDGVKSLYIIK